MDRAYQSGAAGSAPAAPVSPSTGYPTAGNPATATPATKPGPYWYHMIMEELMAIISAAGITPAQGNLTQLLTALRSAGVFQTPGQFDNTTKAATTEFVQRALGSFAKSTAYSAAVTLTAADIGSVVSLGGATTYVATLPSLTGLPNGAGLLLQNVANVTLTVARQGSDLFNINGGADTAFLLSRGDSVFVFKSGTNWVVVGTGVLGFSSSFEKSFATNGYQKLPSGLIIQWGLYTTAGTTNSAAISYPIAFPNNVLNVVATHESSVSGSIYAVATNTQTASSFKLIASGGSGGAYVRWIAIGY